MKKMRFFVGLTAFLVVSLSFKTALPNAETLSAIAELKGTISARMDVIEKKVEDVENYAKAAYGRVREVAKKMEQQEEMQRKALKAVTGSGDMNALIENMDKLAPSGSIKKAPKASLPASRASAKPEIAGVRGLPR